MKLTESQLRRVIRRAVTELFVRPKHRKSLAKRALSVKYTGGYGGEGMDLGFGEFDEVDLDEETDLDEQDERASRRT